MKPFFMATLYFIFSNVHANKDAQILVCIKTVIVKGYITKFLFSAV